MNKKIFFILGAIVLLVIVLMMNTVKKESLTNSSQDAALLSEVGNMTTEDTSLNIADSSTPVSSLNGTKKISASQSKLSWTAQKKILTDWIDKGTINISSGSAVFADNKLVSGEAIVDMASIVALSTGSGSNQERLTNHLKSADFFEVEKYKTSKIVIKSVNGNTATADLTIKDVTKSITFPININISNSGQATILGKLTINRADYGVKYGSTSFFKDLADKAIVDDIFTLDFSIVTE